MREHAHEHTYRKDLWVIAKRAVSLTVVPTSPLINVFPQETVVGDSEAGGVSDRGVHALVCPHTRAGVYICVILCVCLSIVSKSFSSD